MPDLSLIPALFEGKTIRYLVGGGDPWFVAAEVCESLGIKNSRDAVSRLPDRFVRVGSTDTNDKGSRQSNLINEAGLYRLAFQSRKAEAERFTDWVCEEVLPCIRKFGEYRPIPDGLSWFNPVELTQDERLDFISCASRFGMRSAKMIYGSIIHERYVAERKAQWLALSRSVVGPDHPDDKRDEDGDDGHPGTGQH